MGKKLFSFFVLVLSDILVIFLSFTLAHLIRSEFLPHIFPRFQSINLLPLSVWFDRFYMVFIYIFIFAYEGLYTKRLPFWEEVRVLLKGLTVSFTVITVMIFITRKQIQFSRITIVLAWILSLFLLPVVRYLVKYLLVKFNLWKKKLIILGVHETSLAIIRSIKRNVTMGYEVLGFLDNDPENAGKAFHGVRILGTIPDLEQIVKSYKSKDIMLANPHLSRKELKDVLAKCESMSESIWIVPDSGDFITEGVEVEIIGDVLTLYVKKNLVKPWNGLLKFVFDKVLTTTILVILLPLFLIIAVAIKIDSKGSPIFVQKRIGQNKKIFNLFKFRSMFADSEDRLNEYLEGHAEAKQEWEKYRKIKNGDPRVTAVGRVIRRYSLDELPQLFNVLIGNMSLVGPRPYISTELKEKESFTSILARVKPGITGLWQISGRSDLPFEQRLDLDDYYIRNWSLWLDFVILLKSIRAFFSSRGAY